MADNPLEGVADKLDGEDTSDPVRFIIIGRACSEDGEVHAQIKVTSRTYPDIRHVMLVERAAVAAYGTAHGGAPARQGHAVLPYIPSIDDDGEDE